MLDPSFLTFTNQINQQVHVGQRRPEVVRNNITEIYQLGVLKSEKLSVSLYCFLGFFTFGNIIYDGYERFFITFLHELKMDFNRIPTAIFPLDFGFKYYFIFIPPGQEVNQFAKFSRCVLWDEVFQSLLFDFVPRVPQIPKCLLVYIFKLEGFIIKNIDFVQTLLYDVGKSLVFLYESLPFCNIFQNTPCPRIFSIGIYQSPVFGSYDSYLSVPSAKTMGQVMGFFPVFRRSIDDFCLFQIFRQNGGKKKFQ